MREGLKRRLTRRSLTRRWIATIAILAAHAPGAHAQQFQQYKPPGTVADRPGDDKERLENELETALWSLGPLRLNPFIGITNAAVTTNSLGTAAELADELDYTMTLGAGLTGLVPFGGKTFLTFDAIPQYVFWLEQSDRNRFNQWFGTQLFGFYNRLYLGARATRRDQVEVRTSEADAEVNTRRDTGELAAEIRIGHAIHVFGAAGVQEIESREDSGLVLDRFSLLDRTDTLTRTGLRYKPEDRTYIGIGVETSEADFASRARRLGNSGTSPLLQGSYDGPKFFLTGEIVLRDLEPEGEDSEFVPYDEPNGELTLTLDPGWRFSYSAYGRRHLSYALEESWVYFDLTRYGLRVGSELSERWSAALFGELGTDDYTAAGPAPNPRQDDVTSWGVDFDFEISRRFALTFGYTASDWDSDLDAFDRENGRFHLSLSTRELVLGRR